MDIVVHALALREIGLHREIGEAHLGDEEADEAILHRLELVRAVGRLAHGDDAGVPDDPLQGLEVGEVVARFNGGEGNAVITQPYDDLSGYG